MCALRVSPYMLPHTHLCGIPAHRRFRPLIAQCYILLTSILWSLFRRISSASPMKVFIKSAVDGMSWINPMDCPALQIPSSMLPSRSTLTRPRLPAIKLATSENCMDFPFSSCTATTPKDTEFLNTRDVLRNGRST